MLIALQFSVVQTFLTQKVAAYLSSELDAKITVEKVYINPLSSIELQQFEVKDKNDSIIVQAQTIQASFVLTQLWYNNLSINKVKIKDAQVHVHIYKDSSNLSSFINYFATAPKKEENTKSKLSLNLYRVEIENNNFTLVNHTEKHDNSGIDFSDLDIRNFSATFKDIQLDSVVGAEISGFTLREKSGFQIRNMVAKASYSNRKMEFIDLDLKTNRSHVRDYLKFEYDSIAVFSDFLERVNISSRLKNSYVDSRDIEFFAPSLKYVVFETAIKNAVVKGPVAHMSAKDVHITTANHTTLMGNFSIKGLPDIDRTVFDIHLSKLSTSAQDIEVLVPKFANLKSFDLPEQVHHFGHINFSGTFHGFYNSFAVAGLFQTALGNIQTKSHYQIDHNLSYKGQFTSDRFAVNKLVNTTILGTAGLDMEVDGSGLALDDLTLKFKGLLKQAEVNSYSYQQVNIAGDLSDRVLTLTGNVDDTNLKVDYKSQIDWKGKDPNYLLDAQLDYAYLYKLNLTKRDSVIIQKAHINTNLFGGSLNTVTGHLYADSIALQTPKGLFEIQSVNFEAQGNAQQRALTLKSDILDIDMSGSIDLNTIVPYFKSLAMRYAPAINIDQLPYNPQDFDLTLNLKSFKPLAALLDPSLNLDDGAFINASFSSENYTARFVAFSPTVTYQGIKLTNLSVEENAGEKAFSLHVLADRLNFSDSAYIKNISIHNILANDSLVFSVELSEAKSANYVDLQGNIHFAHNAPAYIKFKPSTILINNEEWQLSSDAVMRVSKGKIYINNLLMSQAEQKINLNGVLSNADDKLDIKFDKFSLSSLNGITNPMGISLRGFLSGNLQLSSIFKQPLANINIQTTPIIYNEIPIGKLDLSADLEPTTGIANLQVNLEDETKNGVQLTGQYNFKNEHAPLALEGKLKDMDLIVFQPFLKDLVANLKGKGNAEVKIYGALKQPKISGIGKLTDTEFTVNYLKTHYKLDNQATILDENVILLQDLKFTDAKGHIAYANGVVNLDRLANPYIDVAVKAHNFMILNTGIKDNNLYYGTAFASGDFIFQGPTTALNIDIKAKSENGTVINIPFNSAMTISDSDFIYFMSKDSTENQKREKRSLFQGLTMNMDLNLTPEAEVNLQTHVGSLKGNGTGEISMKISSLGDFEMFGDFGVSQGKFHFTAQDFISKYFDIKEGGTIRWSGKPSEATINLNAIYQQRTAIQPLYNAAGRTGDNERVLAQADMLIKGTLEQPDITFDLNFPQNPYIKDQLQSYFSDVNNVNQQALSLIVRRSFTPSSTLEIGKEVNSTLLSASTELAFNQLNNIISQSLNINFFDLNIRSFNDASASVRLWDDRLILTGGIADRTNYQATDLTFFREGVMTDAELTYRLRKDGSLILRAYNRPYTRNFLIRTNNNDYISAVGLVYRKEFNAIRQFWQQIWRKEMKN
ncbi:translocation/assembly module TamB domain-containing protein [Sphingobacterium sp. Mn56C]|uniref:translocation/assembly module TamB domain-containing protein n=1 Tax=Sphingobacterium sp. Mn56C TaxID=3395261 RepID=UPI003BDB242A